MALLKANSPPGLQRRFIGLLGIILMSDNLILRVFYRWIILQLNKDKIIAIIPL